MEKNQKMIVGLIAIILLVGVIGVFVLFQPTGIALNVSNNSTGQGNSGQSGSNSGSQSSSQGSVSSSGSSDSGSGGASYTCPTCAGTGTISEKINVESCTRCGGSGLEPNSLAGTHVKCSKCGGSGVTPIPGGKTVTKTCPTCDGSGKVPAS